MTSAANRDDFGATGADGTPGVAAGALLEGRGTRLPRRLERLFDTLVGSGVRWCLLRPVATLGQGTGDIDVLVEPSSLGRTRELLISQDFVQVPIGGRDLHVADYEPESDRLLWLHVQTELRLGRGAIAAAQVLERVERDPLPHPTDDWLFWILVLHDILDKRAIPARHRPELTRMAPSVSVQPSPLTAVAENHGLDPPMLVRLVQAEAWGQLQDLGRQEHPRRSVRAGLMAAADRTKGLWTRRGVSVAIMGPDGAGKTTLVRGLCAKLPFPARVIYMGLTGGRLPKADALRVPGLVFAARLTLLWIRYLVGVYHRARGRIVLFDRYTLDGTVPSGARLSVWGKASRRVQAFAVPRPQLLLLLDAPGAVMHSRKGEYDPDQLEQWREAYQRLRRRVPALEVLDAGRPADEVRRDAQARIWRWYADRWRVRR